MYLDTLLFIIGAIFAVIMLAFVIYLMVSRRKSHVYTEALTQESTQHDAITATLSNYINTSMLTRSEKSYIDSEYMGSNADIVSSNLVDDTDRQSLQIQRELKETDTFDLSVIKGSYVIEREVGGGAMSRTFTVRSVKLGNPWFMKVIPKKYGVLASEIDILKQLNHISLPKIIDVFRNDEGVCLIETLIDGAPLNEAIGMEQKISHYLLLDWFEQVSQALNYLHTMKPKPIFHMDVKPGNIMVTHDNRLVLVDFGISRLMGDDTATGITAQYAAPEQFTGKLRDKYTDIITERFGIIPATVESADIDARTDLYSLGVVMFELATGYHPTCNNMDILKNLASDELAAIIRKCLAINPADRYTTTSELLHDLRNVKGTKIKMARLLVFRRVAAIAATLSILISSGTFASGLYIFTEENAASVLAQPEIITVSLQQSTEIAVNKHMRDGRTILLDNNQIAWEFNADNIARIDGNRISGINEGETLIRGQHRNKEVELTVRVIQPVDGLIEVSQRFESGRFISLFSGESSRIRHDGAINIANFISPESIAVANNGTVYISDAGEIRMIRSEMVSTLSIPNSYIKVDKVRTYDNELYILSQPWQDENNYYYTIARINSSAVEAIYIADAVYTSVEDFAFGANGLLYFIDRNEGLGEVLLKTLDLYDVNDIRTLAALTPGSTSVTVAEGGIIYIGNSELGVIQVYRNNNLEFFAGIEGERAFIDGSSSRFYSPQRLEYYDGYLYIWDFNTLRRIEAIDGIAGECITLAGMASPDYSADLSDAVIMAEDVVLPFGSLIDFAVTNDEIFLTDYKRGVVWTISN